VLLPPRVNVPVPVFVSTPVPLMTPFSVDADAPDITICPPFICVVPVYVQAPVNVNPPMPFFIIPIVPEIAVETVIAAYCMNCKNVEETLMMPVTVNPCTLDAVESVKIILR